MGGSTIDGASYTYDYAGNRSSKTNYLNGITENYTYDLLYELTQVTQGNVTTESYSYDAVGNRLSSLGVSPYSYNSSNELTLTPSGSYAYDANGNTTEKPDGTQYAWDFENRLTQVTLPGQGGTVAFKYDPFGRRIQKTAPNGSTNYLYDAVNVLEEADSSGSPTARYTYGIGVDEPIAEIRSGAVSYYQADGLGTVTSLADAFAAISETYSYDASGRLIASTGSIANPFRYTGREFDSETGLYFNRARYYQPDQGRFLSEDPIRFDGGGNFYRYIGNSSPNGKDPTGLWSTAAHHQIIWNALQPCGVSNSDIWQIEQGSDFADRFAFQGGEWSFMHSMSNGDTNQSPADARNRMAQFVANEMNEATTVYNTGGGNDDAMFLFGVAMHPLMDLTSPAHTDQNGNPIPWCGLAPWSCSNWSHHDDTHWSVEDLTHLNANPEAQELENFMIRNWFQALTGKKLKCDSCSN